MTFNKKYLKIRLVIWYVEYLMRYRLPNCWWIVLIGRLNQHNLY